MDCTDILNHQSVQQHHPETIGLDQEGVKLRELLLSFFLQIFCECVADETHPPTISFLLRFGTVMSRQEHPF